MKHKDSLNRIVIALGGNALGNNPEEQQEKVDSAAESLVQLITQGNEIIISHGNGPQVGMINLAFDVASKLDSKVAQIELPECTAMSQGYIGYHLQTRLSNQIITSKWWSSRTSNKSFCKQLRGPKTTVKPVAKLIKEGL